MRSSSSIELEDRSDVAADFRERLESGRVLALALEEPRVFDRDSDVRAELPQHRFVTRRELTDLLAVQVDRADDALLPAQRDDQLRSHVRDRSHVPRIDLDVVDQERPALGDGRADDALSDAQAEALLDVLGIADGVGDVQVLVLLVQQPDRERLERREPRDELRHLLEQLVADPGPR